MNVIPLHVTDFNWTRRESDAADLKALDPLLARRLAFDLQLIHKFELALLDLKNQDCIWGPVHSSVGQEAVAAGAIEALRPGDQVAGTHRAHHQFLVKCMQYELGAQWDPLAGEMPPAGTEVLRRTMAEIMGLASGYCAGRGGSMHLRHREAGFIGSNAIVGGGIPLAAGVAFAEKHRKTGNVVVCFFGDGAVNIGAFHEAGNLIGTLGLPVIMVVENNFYSVATHTDAVCALRDISLRASSYAMDAAVVNGNDVLGIHAAFAQAADSIRAGGRPWMIEARCFRHFHHAGDRPGSAFGYRKSDEEAHWRATDPVQHFHAALLEQGLLNEKQWKQIEALVERGVAQALEACTTVNAENKRAVRPELWPTRAMLRLGVRSGGEELAALTYREREDFKQFTPMKYSDAIAGATGRWLERDPDAVVLGEEIANFGGGAYGATKGLPQLYPNRVLNMPISEGGFVGMGGGAAMRGMRPVIEIMFPDFSLVAADQLFNQIGKARHMYGNTTDLPLIVRIRIAIGCGYGGQHSMDPVGLYALFPGWRIVAPANAFDYIGLFNTAMHSNDPVVVLEHHTLYTKAFDVPTGDLDYCIAFGKARVVKAGRQVSVVTYGVMAERIERMLPRFAAEGIDVELIDLRTVDPVSLDFAAVAASLNKTQALVIVEEAAGSQAIGPRIAARAQHECFDDLDHPIVCLSSADVPLPVSRPLEAAAMLTDDEVFVNVVAAARRTEVQGY
jgi:2-oxoisovalerate dehydrogenase E1 component